MTLDTIIIVLGAFVAVLPFLQLPQNWTDFFAFIAGIAIVGLGIAVRRRGPHVQPEHGKSSDAEHEPSEDTFEE